MNLNTESHSTNLGFFYSINNWYFQPLISIIDASIEDVSYLDLSIGRGIVK